MILRANPIFYHADKFARGQCDAVTVTGKRCTREGVEDRLYLDGKTYLVCRKHRPKGMFRPWMEGQ